MINIWPLIAKKLNKEASSKELEDLRCLLNENVHGNYPMELNEVLCGEENDHVPNERWEKFSQSINNQKEGEEGGTAIN